MPRVSLLWEEVYPTTLPEGTHVQYSPNHSKDVKFPISTKFMMKVDICC